MNNAPVSTETILELVAAHVEAENRHDMDATLRTLHPECVFVDYAMQRTFRGHEGAREHYLLWWSAFDLRVAGERRHVGRATFCAETRFRGRHRGDFMGFAPTGREIDLHVAVFVEIRDGLMSAERFFYDMRGLMAQLACGAP